MIATDEYWFRNFSNVTPITMGDPSSLRFIPASGSTTPINWARVPEASKKALLDSYGYDWENDMTKPLPETVADLAKMFDETKFFGYFKPDILTALMDISEVGLEAATPTGQSVVQVGPRFYMTYVDQVWFFLFAPGKRDCIVGYSDRIARETEQDYDDAVFAKMAADETAMAKEFDVKLEQEVSRGMARLVRHTEKLGGWKASTAQSNLEFSQYADAIMGLPGSHPMHRALVNNILGTFSR
jgi:hypothetical protein